MISRMHIDEPQNVNVTMSITMTVAAWKKLKDQLNRDYPGFRLGQAINDMVSAVETKFYAEPELEVEKKSVAP